MNYFEMLGNAFTRDEVNSKNVVVFGDRIGPDVIAAYESVNPQPYNYNRMFGDIYSDAYFACFNRAIARYMAKTSTRNVYVYEFDHPFVGPLILDIAIHGTELEYLFAQNFNQLYSSLTLEGDDKLVSDMMMDYWGSFAADGTPSSLNFAHWPAYMEAANGVWQTLRIEAPDAATVDNLREDVCNFWDQSGQWY
jgi:para-nitrobenzyl esterase